MAEIVPASGIGKLTCASVVFWPHPIFVVTPVLIETLLLEKYISSCAETNLKPHPIDVAVLLAPLNTEQEKRSPAFSVTEPPDVTQELSPLPAVIVQVRLWSVPLTRTVNVSLLEPGAVAAHPDI